MNTADTLTQLSINLSASNANKDWFSEAVGTVQLLIRKGEDFTTDDVWDIVDQLDVKTHERRALGAIMRDFQKSNDIRQVGYRASDRPECHRRPIAIWRPLRRRPEREGMAD